MEEAMVKAWGQIFGKLVWEWVKMMSSTSENPISPIRVLLVDDNAIMLQQVEELIAAESGFEVVGVAKDGLEVITKARELQPHLVLMDVRLPGQTGLEATRQLKNELPQLKVIILTLYDVPIYRETALAYGAGDFIIKKAMRKELLPAIQRVMDENEQAGCTCCQDG